MAEGAISFQSFMATRVRVETSRSFDQVRSSLLESMGRIGVEKILEHGPAEGGREDFERRVRSVAGAGDFILFLEIDHGKWLPKFGINRRVTRWIFGNPLIAITMIKHDITAAARVPVELSLLENDHGDGCVVVYDLPSSLMATEGNPALLEAAEALDRKVRALVSRATGVNGARGTIT